MYEPRTRAGTIHGLFVDLKKYMEWGDEGDECDGVLGKVEENLGGRSWNITLVKHWGDVGFDPVWDDVVSGTAWKELRGYRRAAVWLRKAIQGQYSISDYLTHTQAATCTSP